MRIIRFIAKDGRIHFGSDRQDGTATIVNGSISTGFAATPQRVKISKLLAPIVPTDIICIGRNYRVGAAESASDERSEDDGGGARSSEPDATLEVFLKPSTSLQNPNDPILIPHFEGLEAQLDCEGELAVVIGRDARNVSESAALNYVFGYTIANDVTARAFQTAGGPPIWMRGKGFDTFCPLGPAIVTTDEIPDPQTLDIRTIINDQVVREGNTRDMIRSVSEIIAALSRHMTLRAGAVILTGAPPAIQPPPAIKSNACVTAEIDPIGRLQNCCDCR